MQGLQGDVGDLAKLVLAKRGFSFEQKDTERKIARELSDCLFSILILAGELDVDLQPEFEKLLVRLEEKISERKVVGSGNLRKKV